MSQFAQLSPLDRPVGALSTDSTPTDQLTSSGHPPFGARQLCRAPCGCFGSAAGRRPAEQLPTARRDALALMDAQGARESPGRCGVRGPHSGPRLNAYPGNRLHRTSISAVPLAPVGSLSQYGGLTSRAGAVRGRTGPVLARHPRTGPGPIRAADTAPAEDGRTGRDGRARHRDGGRGPAGCGTRLSRSGPPVTLAAVIRSA